MRKTLLKMTIAGLFCGTVCLWAALAADQLAAGSLIIVDSTGKEQKVKEWSFTQGTRRLSWLVPPPAAKEEPAKPPVKARPTAGPEALEFREENSTTFVDGILTLVPLEHLRAIEYDDKDGVAVHVFLGPKAAGDLTLKGTTKYKGINKTTIEAEVDKGDLGVAQLKFLGGIPKGVRAVRFESPRPVELPKGRPAFVTVADKGPKTPAQVFDLLPLYQMADGHELLLPLLMFKKTLKVDVGTIQKIAAPEGRDPDAVEWTVTLKDGSELTLSLLKSITHEGRTLNLEGLVGRVAAGYRLFPLHTFTAVQFDETKGEKPPP